MELLSGAPQGDAAQSGAPEKKWPRIYGVPVVPYLHLVPDQEPGGEPSPPVRGGGLAALAYGSMMALRGAEMLHGQTRLDLSDYIERLRDALELLESD